MNENSYRNSLKHFDSRCVARTRILADRLGGVFRPACLPASSRRRHFLEHGDLPQGDAPTIAGATAAQA
jgi:hypothetical protein